MDSALINLDARLSYSFQRLVTFVPSFWKWLAILGVYTIPVFLVWYWFARDRLIALRAAVTGIVAWFGFNSVISHFLVRERPPQLAFLNYPAHEFIFDRPGPSFPSDHAAFMTAIALSFLFAGERKLAPYLGLIAVLTVLARVVTAQHWVGDILMGIVVGLISALLIRAVHKPLDHWILKPLIKLVGKVGL
jgi:undecaprenyl-diphosphatase